MDLDFDLDLDPELGLETHPQVGPKCLGLNLGGSRDRLGMDLILSRL